MFLNPALTLYFYFSLLEDVLRAQRTLPAGWQELVLKFLPKGREKTRLLCSVTTLTYRMFPLSLICP